MLNRLFNCEIIRPQDLEPSRKDMRVIGVFNPGVVLMNGEVVLLLRVAETAAESRPGFTPSPRYLEDGEMEIDWLKNSDLQVMDSRWVRLIRDRTIRLTHASHLRVVRSRDGRMLDSVDTARFMPGSQYEAYGVEDARITELDHKYYFTYVSVSSHGAATSLASTRDFISFERHGIIFPPDNKDVVLFPEKIDGCYVALHRPSPATAFSVPEIWLANSSDLISWGRHRQLRTGRSIWEAGRTGPGTPPVRTERGWLEIYHGNQPSENPQVVGAYSAGAILLDLEHPGRIRAQSAGAILTPEASFEREGFVPDVVFPTGIIEREDRFQIYYGAADTSVGLVELPKKELLDSLV